MFEPKNYAARHYTLRSCPHLSPWLLWQNEWRENADITSVTCDEWTGILARAII